MMTKVDMTERSIPFTQYIPPYGRTMDTKTVCNLYTDEVLNKAQAFIDAGFRFEVEILTTGMVSMTISDDDGDYVNVLSRNGEEIPKAVMQLINRHTVEEIEEFRDDAHDFAEDVAVEEEAEEGDSNE